jgi:hypothetical protein
MDTDMHMEIAAKMREHAAPWMAWSIAVVIFFALLVIALACYFTVRRFEAGEPWTASITSFAAIAVNLLVLAQQVFVQIPLYVGGSRAAVDRAFWFLNLFG